jgi:hypothetical protein
LHRLEENIGAAKIDLRPADLHDIEAPASKSTYRGPATPKAIEKLNRG